MWQQDKFESGRIMWDDDDHHHHPHDLLFSFFIFVFLYSNINNTLYYHLLAPLSDITLSSVFQPLVEINSVTLNATVTLSVVLESADVPDSTIRSRLPYFCSVDGSTLYTKRQVVRTIESRIKNQRMAEKHDTISEKSWWSWSSWTGVHQTKLRTIL